VFRAVFNWKNWKKMVFHNDSCCLTITNCARLPVALRWSCYWRSKFCEGRGHNNKHRSCPRTLPRPHEPCFLCFSWVCLIFHDFSWFFMFFHDFSWFSWFFMFFSCFFVFFMFSVFLVFFRDLRNLHIGPVPPEKGNNNGHPKKMKTKTKTKTNQWPPEIKLLTTFKRKRSSVIKHL